MAERTQRVTRWLGAVFGSDRAPQFEVNTRTVDLLGALADVSALRCQEVALLAEDCRQKAAEYRSEASYLQEVLLQAGGLQPGSFSKPTLDLLTVLESSAEVLCVKDTSMGSFVPALNVVSRDLSEGQRTHTRLQRELTAVRRKTAATMVLRKKLQEDLQKISQMQQVEAATAEERLLNMDFMVNKSKDFTRRNKTAQDKLTSRQMKDSLTHDAIVKISERVTLLKQDVGSLMKNLEPYNDLSPSPALARVRIEEVKRELAALDAELEQKVDLMNTLSK